MITALIIGRWRGEKHFVVLSGPEVPVHEQRAKYRQLSRVRENAELESVEYWTSQTGREMQARFRQPVEPVSPPATVVQDPARAEPASQPAEPPAPAQVHAPAPLSAQPARRSGRRS